MIRFQLKSKVNSELSDNFATFLKNYKPSFSESLQSKPLLEKISNYGKELSRNNSTLCVVGLGGSSLGTCALYDSLSDIGSKSKIVFFDNVDAYSFEKNFSLINKNDCHWLFVSKSGSTIEVLNLINLISQKYESFDAKSMCTIITNDQPSLLFDWGKRNEVKMLHIPLEVGGRFSVFTPVGLLPLAFMGKDLNDVVSGYEWALEQNKLMSEICSSWVESFARDEWIHLYWIYSDSLQSFGLWLQQLWMESLGKKNNLNGELAPRVSSLFTARGASDQHSILQQISEGAKDKFIVFLGDQRAENFGDKINKSNFKTKNELTDFSLGKLCSIEMKSTYEALAADGVSASSLFIEDVNTKSISALMSLYMMTTVALADYLNINPFDQPGVESSKQHTKSILSGLNA